MLKNFKHHKTIWTKSFTHSVVAGLILLVSAMIINAYATNYVTAIASSPVTDILLSNIPVFDVDGIIIYLALAFIVFVAVLIILDPRKLPFVLKSVALFVLIRSVFISLTHIAPFPGHDDLNVGPFLQLLGLGNSADLFFSGHTGLPFLMSLIFWRHKVLRLIFLAGSVILGIAVLLGHVHYSIDVLGAFFITYTIFHIVQVVFPEDWHLANTA